MGTSDLGDQEVQRLAVLCNMLLVNSIAVGWLWHNKSSRRSKYKHDEQQWWVAALDVGFLEEGVQRLAKAELRKRKSVQEAPRPLI